MINTEDIIWELQDQVQRLDRKVNWLVSRVGGDPEEIGALPDEPVQEARKAA